MKETRPIAAPDQWPRNSSNTTSAVPRSKGETLFYCTILQKHWGRNWITFFIKRLNSKL
jgi:hypothetical protein